MAILCFKKLSPKAQIPEYKSKGAAGMDICNIYHNQVHYGEVTEVSTALAVEIPQGYELQVRARSGLARDHGVMVVNSPGTIDSDYRGEIKILLTTINPMYISGEYNSPLHLKPGTRVAQLVLAKVARPLAIKEVKELRPTLRGSGGFGSTGR